MRRCVYILLILLLPLRAWVGDAMAMQMAIPTLAHDAMPVATAPHSGHAGSHRHEAQPAQQVAADACGSHAEPEGRSDAAHCEPSGMCQTCHTVAISTPMTVPVQGRFASAAPQRVAQGFTSADRALAQKPPVI